MIFILSDQINSGKSTYVLKLAEKLIAQGARISGFVTTPHIQESRKIGQDLVLIKNGKIKPAIPFTRLSNIKDSFRWRRFNFSRRALAEVRQIEPSGDLFIMDEIGPLELDEQGGFYQAAKHIATAAKNVIIVVRSELVDRIGEILGTRQLNFYSLDTKQNLETDLKSL